jgi:hypothetical protein
MAFNVHIKNSSLPCRCRLTVSYEALTIVGFIKYFNNNCVNTSTDYAKVESFQKPLEFNSRISTWKTFGKYLVDLIIEKIKEDVKGGKFQRYAAKGIAASLRMQFVVMIKRHRDNISCFSMDLVKGMFRQLDFINKICGNYEYWTNSNVILSSIERYQKFLSLMKLHSTKMLVPTLDIDLVWHTHQTFNPTEYRNYTKRVVGKVVDHDDTVSHEDLTKAYARTFIFWSKAFNESYSAHAPDRTAWQKNHAASSILMPPYGLYRLYVWKKHSSVDKHVSNIPEATLVPTTESLSVIGTPVHEKKAQAQNSNSNNNVSSCAIVVAGGGCGGGCATSGCAASGCGGTGLYFLFI